MVVFGTQMAVSDKENMTNLFSRKKYELPTLQSIQSYGSSLVNPQQNMSVAPKSTQSVYKPLFSPQTQTNNYFTQAPKPIQGSGMTNTWASNPTTYKAPAPQVPPPQVPPANTNLNTYNAGLTRIDDYLKKITNQSTQRVSQEEAAGQKQQELIDQRYNLANENIRGSIPNLQNIFNTYKTNTNADIAEAVRQGEVQKEQARDYAAESNRTAAQARQESQAQARQKFAAQGAVDSGGAGSYQMANENIDSDFNRYVQQNSKELTTKLTDIDAAVGQYQRQASSLIQNEESKLIESIRQIEFTLADNEIAKNQAIQEAYQKAQDRINVIKDTLSGIEQQAIEQKNTLEIELEKINKTALTPEFMATGVPSNQAEYEFMVKNKDFYKDTGLISSQPKLTSTQENKVQLANSGIRALDELESIFQSDPNVVWKSAIPGQLGAREYSAAATRAVEGLLRARSGAAVPESEIKRYIQANLPRFGDTPAASQSKLAAFRKDLQDVAASGGNISNASNEIDRLRQAGFSDAEIQEYIGG